MESADSHCIERRCGREKRGEEYCCEAHERNHGRKSTIDRTAIPLGLASKRSERSLSNSRRILFFSHFWLLAFFLFHGDSKRDAMKCYVASEKYILIATPSTEPKQPKTAQDLLTCVGEISFGDVTPAGTLKDDGTRRCMGIKGHGTRSCMVYARRPSQRSQTAQDTCKAQPKI